MSVHATGKPLASDGLTSYRYRGRYGWIMIGATDVTSALDEARRSTSVNITPDRLQVWDDETQQYKAVR